MTALEFVKAAKRMCNYYVTCDYCPATPCGESPSCLSALEQNDFSPALCVEIVETWVDEHPIKTI